MMNSKTAILYRGFYECAQSHVQGLEKLCYWNKETRFLPIMITLSCGTSEHLTIWYTWWWLVLYVWQQFHLITIRSAMPGSIPRETSLISSAAAWQPWTSILVQVDRSRCVSTRKRCISMPCREPVLVANVRSEPREGDRHPEPEWTNLGPQTEQRLKVLNVLSEEDVSNLCWLICRKL